MEEVEIREYLGLEGRRKKSKYILIIGIFLVVLSIILAILSSQEYYYKKSIEGSTTLKKDTPFYITFSSELGYSYVYNGTLLLNSTRIIIIWVGDKLKAINGSVTIDMKNYPTKIRIEAVENETILNYRASYIIANRPFFFLSIPSFLILIVGSLVSFMGLFLFLSVKRSSMMK